MISEKSLYYYGRPYHLLLDRAEQEMRRQICARVGQGSTVLDVGCGTGELALHLAHEKECRVLGIDISKRMIDFACKRNQHGAADFRLKDASEGFADLEAPWFDFAVVSQLLHEMPAENRVPILRAVAGVAEKVVLFDWNAPLPGGVPGLVPRVIEGTLGRDHRRNFRSFVESGGLSALVRRAGLEDRVTETAEFSHATGRLMVLTMTSPALRGSL